MDDLPAEPREHADRLCSPALSPRFLGPYSGKPQGRRGPTVEKRLLHWQCRPIQIHSWTVISRATTTSARALSVGTDEDRLRLPGLARAPTYVCTTLALRATTIRWSFLKPAFPVLRFQWLAAAAGGPIVPQLPLGPLHPSSTRHVFQSFCPESLPASAATARFE